MTDRELLELAAKAAGYEFCGYDPDGGGSALVRKQPTDTHTEWWLPHRDDGDALRLAVKLDIGFEPMRCLYEVRAGNGEQDIVTEKVTMGYGFEEATRRAIVRAAAEIGKQK